LEDVIGNALMNRVLSIEDIMLEEIMLEDFPRLKANRTESGYLFPASVLLEV